ncbi:chemotaxis protein CheW [Bacterioplanes sanyensis]|uniref:chemotaxis protein CheW n=1 Tax=Bacterioplanes sanyensis TaxID=1249553 RepID=UPI00167A1E0C|nr:chemotaxis protein CheW [Bacterioplanes sanyensis]GGY44091.1 chemotaxis protein CheW [Bacterioplanes sanyensis]
MVATHRFQYLTFYCGRELFGLSVDAVKQIIEPDEMTRIPGAASYIRGVIEVDDDVIPIVDLPMKVGAPVQEQGVRRSCVVLAKVALDDAEATIGLWVTEVREIVEVDVDDIRTAPHVHDVNTDRDCVSALAHTDQGLLVLIDAGEILTMDEVLSSQQLSSVADVGSSASI